MIIKATQEVNVNLDDSQQKKIAIEYLFKQADWKSSYSINEDDGWVYNDKVCHTTHSFTSLEKVRIANDEDKMIHKIVKSHFFNL